MGVTTQVSEKHDNPCSLLGSATQCSLGNMSPIKPFRKDMLLGCRGHVHLSCIEAMGLASAFKHSVNGRSYLEVHHRVSGSKTLQILSLKANDPDDAALWLRDMQAGQKVTLA